MCVKRTPVESDNVTESNQVDTNFAAIAAQHLVALRSAFQDVRGVTSDTNKIAGNEFPAFMKAGATLIGAQIVADAIRQATDDLISVS